MAKKLLVLDGNSIINRAFYGIKLLSTKNGEFTNAIYGFLTMFRKLLDETEPDATAIAFDLKAPTFRHKEYAGYKAKRKGMPEELAQQMPVLQELLTDMGYKIVTCEGYEADDILGTLAAACEKDGNSCLIATGDRDSLQLVSDKTSVRLASTKFGQPQVTLYDVDAIHEEYGVTPAQMIDLKAIQGDASDNIPGVAGIGEKGASELIKKFGSLKYIYDNIDEIDIKDGMRLKLKASEENAFLSERLGTICKDVPVDTSIDAYVKTDGDPQKVSSTMVRLELFSLIDKFGFDQSDAQAVPESEDCGIVKVTEYKDGAPILARADDTGEAYFYTLYADDGSIEKMFFTFDDEVCVFEPSEHFLRAFFKDKNIKKFTHDVKPLHKAAMRLGEERVESVAFDTLLAAYLLNPSASGYDVLRLAAEYAVTVANCEGADHKIAAAMPELCKKLIKEIDKNEQRKLLDDIEIPLAEVLADMEVLGFYVDANGIEQYGRVMQEQIDDLQAKIYEQAGVEFNISSPKQLGEILFDKLGLPHGKKTKTGWSTSADILNELRPMNPIIDDVLQYRTVAKLKSTYCDGLLKVIADDGRIHSTFNQAETRTGRISSTEPNMQNIPVRTPIGRELRKFFAAESGVLVDADYSQIELRVLACVANDKAMQEDFAAGRDIHASTASRVFNMPMELMTDELRSRAKAVNFGIVYGIGAYSLSGDIGVSVKEAKEYIEEYLKNYSGVANYMKETVETAKEKGYVETLFGRRRYLPELKSSNFNMRAFGERVAMNMPIQGAAADIIKIAMIKVRNRLKAEKLEARLILQVHDELIVECPESETSVVESLLKEEMENAVDLAVPMKADAGSGKTWYDAKM